MPRVDVGVRNASDTITVDYLTAREMTTAGEATTTGDLTSGANLTVGEEKRGNPPRPSAAECAKSCSSELAISVDGGDDLDAGRRMWQRVEAVLGFGKNVAGGGGSAAAVGFGVGGGVGGVLGGAGLKAGGRGTGTRQKAGDELEVGGGDKLEVDDRDELVAGG